MGPVGDQDSRIAEKDLCLPLIYLEAGHAFSLVNESLTPQAFPPTGQQQLLSPDGDWY